MRHGLHCWLDATVQLVGVMLSVGCKGWGGSPLAGPPADPSTHHQSTQSPSSGGSSDASPIKLGNPQSISLILDCQGEYVFAQLQLALATVKHGSGCWELSEWWECQRGEVESGLRPALTHQPIKTSWNITLENLADPSPIKQGDPPRRIALWLDPGRVPEIAVPVNPQHRDGVRRMCGQHNNSTTIYTLCLNQQQRDIQGGSK